MSNVHAQKTLMRIRRKLLLSAWELAFVRLTKLLLLFALTNSRGDGHLIRNNLSSTWGGFPTDMALRSLHICITWFFTKTKWFGYADHVEPYYIYISWKPPHVLDNLFCSVHGANLTLIQPTWSAYPYHLVIPYMGSICPYFSLNGNGAHFSVCGIATGCSGRCIVPRTAIVMSQWYDHYCSAEYTQTWARHLAAPWQRECTAIADCQSINTL